MRRLLIVIFVASVLLTWVSFIYLPEEVATHFGGKGMPDAWGTKGYLALVFLVMDLSLFLIFLLVPFLIPKMPVWLISMPSREYWWTKENLPRFKSIFEELWWEYGAAVLLFILLTKALTIDANLSNPVQLNYGVFWFLFVAFMAYTVYWVIKMCRAFAVPKNASEPRI
jgi:uncharacterized membrane protein